MSSNPITVPHEVPFNSGSLLLVEHQNVPFVPLQPLLKSIGLGWRNAAVQRSLKRFKTAVVKIPTVYQTVTNAFECLPLRKLPAWLMTIELTRVDAKARKQLMAYQNGCDDALWDHWIRLRESSATVTLTYEGRRFRFRYIGSECWYVAADVVAALGLRDTATLLAGLPQHMRLIQQIGGRRLNTINQAGLDQIYLSAPPRCTEHLRTWLARVTNDAQQRVLPCISAVSAP